MEAAASGQDMVCPQSDCNAVVYAEAGYVWWNLADVASAPLPAPVKKLLAQLAEPNLFA